MKALEFRLCEICANELAVKPSCDVFLGNAVMSDGWCEGCGHQCNYEYTFVQINPRQIEAMEGM